MDDLVGIDRRVLQLETIAKVMESEVASLRATRHEHSNWLNRHNLEISASQMKVTELVGLIANTSDKVSAIEKELQVMSRDITAQINGLKSDLRQTMWVVSVIVGVVVFVGRAIASKFGL
jgi:hypothetical protein